MEKFNNNFLLMSDNDLQETDGGWILEAVLATATILGGYAVIREMVRDKGFNDAIKGK